MSNNFGYIDIILLAMIAGFIILRLRNILGRKTGHETRYILILMRKDLKLSIKKILMLMRLEMFWKDKIKKNS